MDRAERFPASSHVHELGHVGNQLVAALSHKSGVRLQIGYGKAVNFACKWVEAWENLARRVERVEKRNDSRSSAKNYQSNKQRHAIGVFDSNWRVWRTFADTEVVLELARAPDEKWLGRFCGHFQQILIAKQITHKFFCSLSWIYGRDGPQADRSAEMSVIKSLEIAVFDAVDLWLHFLLPPSWSQIIQLPLKSRSLLAHFRMFALNCQ